MGNVGKDSRIEVSPYRCARLDMKKLAENICVLRYIRHRDWGRLDVFCDESIYDALDSYPGIVREGCELRLTIIECGEYEC